MQQKNKLYFSFNGMNRNKKIIKEIEQKNEGCKTMKILKNIIREVPD